MSTNDSHGTQRIMEPQDWERIKGDVHRLYMVQKKPLEWVQAQLQAIHGFQACVSIWKAKLKEWKFPKNLPRDTMHAIVAVQAQRATLKRKRTAFFCGEMPITEKRIENFKKKHCRGLAPLTSFTLPDDIRYHTPSPESEGESSSEETYGRPTECVSTSIRVPSSTLGHFGSIYSHQSITESVESYRIDVPDEPQFSLIGGIDRWLSNEQQTPWSHLKLGRGLSSPEDTAGDNLNLFDEFRMVEYPLEDYNTWPDVPIPSPRDVLDSRSIMIDEQEMTVSDESTLKDASTLATQLGHYLRQNREHSPQALKLRFQLAESLVLIGKYDEAEDHCDALEPMVTQESLAALLGTILVKTRREEEATNCLFTALTNFILNCTNHTFQQNERIFGRIYYLFGETLWMSEQNWDSLVKPMKQLMATFNMLTPDEDVRRICPELFIHGFQIAHECKVLNFVYAAKYMYKHLLEGSTPYLNGRGHASEKAQAHQMYGLLLKGEENWISSAKQLLLACESTIESGSDSHQYVTILRINFNNLIPHLQSENNGASSIAKRIEGKLEYLKNKISALKNGLEHSPAEQVERLLQSNLPWVPRAVMQSVMSLQAPMVTLPVRSIVPSQGNSFSNSTVTRRRVVNIGTRTSKKSAGSELISSNMSGDGSHENGETWPRSEFDECAGIEDLCYEMC